MLKSNFGVMDWTREANPPKRGGLVDPVTGAYVAEGGGLNPSSVLRSIGTFFGMKDPRKTPAATGGGMKRKRPSRTNGRNASGSGRDNDVACTCGAEVEFRRKKMKGPPWAKHESSCEKQLEFTRRREARKRAKMRATGGGGMGQRPLQFL